MRGELLGMDAQPNCSCEAASLAHLVCLALGLLRGDAVERAEQRLCPLALPLQARKRQSERVARMGPDASSCCWLPLMCPTAVNCHACPASPPTHLGRNGHELQPGAQAEQGVGPSLVRQLPGEDLNRNSVTAARVVVSAARMVWNLVPYVVPTSGCSAVQCILREEQKNAHRTGTPCGLT